MASQSTVTNGAKPAEAMSNASADQKPTTAAPPQPATAISVMNGAATPKQSPSLAAQSTATSEVARTASPIRYPRKTSSSSRLRGTRSRTNSQQDLSPTRPSRSQIPSYTAAARSLSSSGTPSLPPAKQEQPTPTAMPHKTAASIDARDGARWPVSPRLRSPPPQPSRLDPATPKPAPDTEPPAINIQQASPAPQPADNTPIMSEKSSDDANTENSGTRTPVRSALETVQEVATPGRDAGLLEKVKEKLVLPEQSSQSDGAMSDGGRNVRSRPSPTSNESGSDSSVNRTESRRTTSVPPPMPRQSSSLSTKQKAKPEGSTQNMTVETETVASIPQVALNTGNKGDGTNGTLKAKQSTETIRPRKDKKKSTRKQASVSNATGSSKADIFEAKIASAVDEANTSDSEETFVYDSNPPDAADRSARRFHSRTPSATSMASQAGRQDSRSIYGVLEGHGPVPKKSMKFVNTFNGSGTDGLTTGDEDGKGTGRSAGGSGRGTTRHHHHIGRWGRQPGNGHASIFDNESPFSTASRSKLNGHAKNSGATSPRNHTSPRGLSTKRSALQMSSIYDMEEAGGADDERTPLMNSTRRSGRRRGPHNLRQAESQTYTRRSSYLNRFAACLVLTMMFLLVITGAIGFMFATSQPMSNIEIVSIDNVVTSEQVLMFDVTIKAHNPNIVLVTIDQTDLEIFAKSDHAGTDRDWWSSPDGPGDGNDAAVVSAEADDRPNILLGRITEFDSPLTFGGSLFQQGMSTDTGGMKLPYPGNGTAGGAARWEKIYQNNFDLIIKGVVKYSLPLSARVRSATVSGRTKVKPNSANDPVKKPNQTEPVS